MKRLSVPLGFAAMALTIALPHISQAASKPPNNRYLVAPLYAITHFDSSQSDATTYGPPKGSYYSIFKFLAGSTLLTSGQTYNLGVPMSECLGEPSFLTSRCRL